MDTLRNGGRSISRRLQEIARQVVPEWLKIPNLQDLRSEGDSPPCKPQTESFWRTMVGGLIVKNNRQPGPYDIRPYESTDFKNVNEWLRWVIGGGERSNLMIESSTWAAIYGRSFFITKKGYMGLSYPGIQPEDEVWVLYGGRVPFILRPQPHESGTCSYMFVSDSLLDGFMYGEAIDDPEYPETDVILR